MRPAERLEATQPPAAPPVGAVGSRRSRIMGGRGSVVVSVGSTVVFFLLIGVLFATAPGAEQVRNAFFAREHLARAFPQVLRGFWINVQLFTISEALVLVIALFFAVLRGLPGPVLFPVRVVAIAYIDFFRGMPLLLWLFIVAFGLRGLGLGGISRLSTFQYGIIGLTMVYSAYVAEVYRAGIESIHESQTAAARSLGLSRWKAMRFVVLPQAIRRVVPPLLNDFIGLQKDTVLVAAIGIVEAARQGQGYSTTYFNFAGFVVAAILFISVTIPLARLVDYLIARQQRRMRGGGAVR